MKSSLILKTCLTLLLTPLIAAAPAPRFPINTGCVCVTSPCPCAGDDPDTYLKVRTALPPEEPKCLNDPDGGCWDPDGTLKRSPQILDDNGYCEQHPAECRHMDNLGIGKEKREPMEPVDPLKWCLDNWEDCKALGG